jgi:Uma2 family endonuclease
MADVQTQLLTGDDLLEIGAHNPDRHYELIEGELIELPPAGIEHNNLEGAAAVLLRLFVRERRLGRVLPGETGFYTRGDDRTVRAPDVVFISYDRLPADQPDPGCGRVVPELVIEVVSPNDRADKIEEKVQERLGCGVLLVWVIYPQTQRIHVFQHGQQPLILRADDTITGEPALPGFHAAVREFFED